MNQLRPYFQDWDRKKCLAAAVKGTAATHIEGAAAVSASMAVGVAAAGKNKRRRREKDEGKNLHDAGKSKGLLAPTES